MKTMREWFNLVEDDELRQKMFDNHEKYKIDHYKTLDTKYHSFSNALGYGFVFDKTPEGYNYWDEIRYNPPKLKSESTSKFQRYDVVQIGGQDIVVVGYDNDGKWVLCENPTLSNENISDYSNCDIQGYIPKQNPTRYQLFEVSTLTFVRHGSAPKEKTPVKYKIGDKVNCIEGGKQVCEKNLPIKDFIPSSKFTGIYTIVDTHYSEYIGWLYQVENTRVYGNWISEAGLSLVKSEECQWKEGDWVYVTGLKLKDSFYVGNLSNAEIGDIKQVESIIGNSLLEGVDYWIKLKDVSGEISSNLLRKATPEEIQFVTKSDDSWIKPGVWLFADNPYSSYHKVTYIVEVLSTGHTRGEEIRVKSKKSIEWDYKDTVLEKYRPATPSEIKEYKHYYPEYDSLFGKSEPVKAEDVEIPPRDSSKFEIGKWYEFTKKFVADIASPDKNIGDKIQVTRIEDDEIYYLPEDGSQNCFTEDSQWGKSLKPCDPPIENLCKEEYKVGDYIVPIVACGSSSDCAYRIGELHQITDFYRNESRIHTINVENKTTNGWDTCNFRKAIQEEIDAVIKPKTEESLPKTSTMESECPFKPGDEVLFAGKRCYFVGVRPDTDNQYIIERENGWSRNTDIPKEYQSKLTNQYWYVHLDNLTFVQSNSIILEVENSDDLPPGDRITVEYWKQFIGRKVKLINSYKNYGTTTVRGVSTTVGNCYYFQCEGGYTPNVPGISKWVTGLEEQCILLPEDYTEHVVEQSVYQQMKQYTPSYPDDTTFKGIWDQVEKPQSSFVKPIIIDVKEEDIKPQVLKHQKPILIQPDLEESVTIKLI